MENKVLFWDFDGTLVYCHHLWSSSMWRAITDEPAGEDITLEEVRPICRRATPGTFPILIPLPFPLRNCGGRSWKNTFTKLPALWGCRHENHPGTPKVPQRC